MSGALATMYPVIIVKHTCIPNSSNTQNPLPHAFTADTGEASPQMRAKIKQTPVSIQQLPRHLESIFLSKLLILPPNAGVCLRFAGGGLSWV